jgi:hypothetical protein
LTIPDPGKHNIYTAVWVSKLFSDAEKPEEWDDEEDGEWIGPVVENPKCKEASGCGPWKA